MLILYASCSSEKRLSPSFTEFDFSYNDTWSSSFSIRFTPSDTVYVRQHFWYGNHIASQTDLKEGTTYIGLLNKEQTRRLDSFITHLDIKKYATWYIEDVQDGTSYDFYLKTDSIEQSIGLYGVSVPAPLLAFGQWIFETKEQLILSAVDTGIKFRSYRPLPPPPGLDLRKFVPPTSSE